jgi:hypothetical protein
MPTVTPRVPIQTPMFDERGLLTRTWVIFFERLGLTEGAGAVDDICHRTLLLKDLTVGDDVADHVPAYAAGTGIRVIAALRLAITSDLSVRINRNGVALGTYTVPAATIVDTPVEFTTGIEGVALSDLDVFSWDVTASDGQVDAAGVASFTVEWQREI